MKHYSIILAASAMALAACTSENYLGENETAATGQKAISFDSGAGKITRASGKDAATALDNQFIVYGEKNETDDGAAPTTGNLVFPNYQVNYDDGTAYNSTSNTAGWEYVGATHSTNYQANIKYGTTSGSSEAQTIKYWDYGASNYVFTAVSAKKSEIESGDVKITKTTEATSGNKVYDKGYTIVLTANASLDNIYLADREVITTKNSTVNREADNEIGGNVTFTFRNLATKIRVAMYETVPGYSVTIDNFYYVDATTPTFATMETAVTDKFVANVPNVKGGTAGNLIVKYSNATATLNQPTVSFDGTAANYITLGTNLKANTTLGTSSSAPTYDTDGGTYTSVFPQEANAKTLKLKVDYTLTAPVTGETITVTGATAEIPAEYLQWKPNYSYTYLFKISDNSNGYTGATDEPAGLYPITFDAVTVETTNGTANYITTVSEASITTFGVSSGKYVAASTDYAANSDIYATFVEGSTVQTPVLGGTAACAVNVYKVDDNATEAQVAEWIANSKATHYSNVNTDGTTQFTAVPSVVTTVPGEDGVDITDTHALKLTGVKAGTYAIEYTNSTAWSGSYTKVYKIVKVN